MRHAFISERPLLTFKRDSPEPRSAQPAEMGNVIEIPEAEVITTGTIPQLEANSLE
jgi:hypothetical protein